ncbi:MAG: heat-inducible transcription repressor HrcA [Deltaproteobacteria bacterium]|nr:heat-inducible transcription repressor HrcA [Deltaproteobacteria bacterium]
MGVGLPSGPPAGPMVDLNLRARRILQAVVSEYIATGDAVGSRTVTKRHGIELSAATVRNVMSDLEEAGLLLQPHTSAGRLPTVQGLRYFVDSLLKVRSLTPVEKEGIRTRFAGRELEFQEVMRDTSRMLSELSHHAALVLVPRAETDVLEQLQFVPLRSGGILAVLVTRSGLVQNRLITADVPLSPGDLDRIHNYLNQLLGGLTLEEVRGRVMDEARRERDRLDAILEEALKLGAQAVGAGGTPDVIVDGQANLIAKDVDVERVKALLKALEEKKLLVRLLEGTASAPGVRVFIGAELEQSEFADCSVVTARYGPDDQPVGTIGIIGPVHMNYSKVIPLVDFTAEIVTNVLKRRGEG